MLSIPKALKKANEWVVKAVVPVIRREDTLALPLSTESTIVYKWDSPARHFRFSPKYRVIKASILNNPNLTVFP